MASRGQLACQDVEWNSAYGRINYGEAFGLWERIPGCKLSTYARLVALSTSNMVQCSDILWHRNVRLISVAQFGWLRAGLVAKGLNCGEPFGTGLKFVNSDIAPGRYVSTRNTSCYWERLSGFGGTTSEIIGNEIVSGQAIVDILATDLAFGSSRCETWIPYAAPVTPAATIGNGFWVVGEQIQPGRYRSDAITDGCYWARLRYLLRSARIDHLEQLHRLADLRGHSVDRCRVRVISLWSLDQSGLSGPSGPSGPSAIDARGRCEGPFSGGGGRRRGDGRVDVASRTAVRAACPAGSCVGRGRVPGGWARHRR